MTELTDEQSDLEDRLLNVVEKVLDKHMISEGVDVPEGFVIDMTDAVLSYLITHRWIE